MTTKISSADNPALANSVIQAALKPEEKGFVAPQILPPSDTSVYLPGGYVDTAGQVHRTAEVRELNGNDEEAISKTSNFAKTVLVILSRGTVSVGPEKATEQILDRLLIGDRDALLVGILKATFGNIVETSAYCAKCQKFKDIAINVDEDIKSKVLSDPIADRMFSVQGKAGEIIVQLPDGAVQKKMISNEDKTQAELSTVLLENTVTSINGTPVYSAAQVQALSVLDRRKILDEINARVPGPTFDDVVVKCPECEGEVNVPTNLGTLFRF